MKICIWYTVFLVTEENDHELERISVDIFLFFVNQGFVLVTFQ